MDDESEETFIRVDDKMPEKNVRVVVVCTGARCLGFLGEDGVWRRHYGQEPIHDVIGWVP